MYRNHSVGVVMPAYNEEGFVGDVVREMPSFVDQLYVVDDRSTDGTWEEILGAAADDRENRADREGRDERGDRPVSARGADGPIATDGGSAPLSNRAVVHDPIGRVVPIRHRENRGAGGAIKTGYLAALADTVDVVVTVDADGQMDLSQLPRLLDPIVEGSADYAKGNRLSNREYRSAMPTFRLFGNLILTLLTNVASGYWETEDPQNGYTAISSEALAAVDVEGLYEYYGYCNDLLVKLNASEMRVADVAMPAVYGDERSSIAYSSYVPKVSWLLLRDFLWRLKTKYIVRDFHPLVLCYLFGASTTVAGTVGITWTLYAALSLVGLSFTQGLASLSLVVVGCTFLLFAMAFDIVENEHLETEAR